MTSRPNLIQGAGPEDSPMGGSNLMRRPSAYRPTRTTTATPGWAHPYTGPAALAVFYNDGGNDPDGGGNDPGGAAQPVPKPGPPANVLTMSQEDLTALSAREKAQGKRAGAREAMEKFAADNGFNSVEDAAKFIEEARKAREAQLSEQEKKEQALAKREQEIAAREQAAIAREKNATRRAVLVSLGAIDTEDQPNLQDATALLEHALRDEPDADEQRVREVADALKGRRQELFGTTRQNAQQEQQPAMAPAPGGAPAGGPPARTPAPKLSAKDRAHKLAVQMGYAKDDAA